MHLLNLDYAHKLYTLHREDFPPSALGLLGLVLRLDSKTPYYSHWKKIKIYPFFCQAQQRLKEICAVNQQLQEQPQKSHKQDTSD